MFFLTYLGHELLRRKRQTIVIALGLAVGIGLVMTVTAASNGVRRAQAQVLHSLYGLGTDVTVTTTPPKSGSGKALGAAPAAAAGRREFLTPPQGLGVLDAASVPAVARLSGVASAAGGLTLVDTALDPPKPGDGGPRFPMPASFTVEGVDPHRTGLGPYASTTIGSGRSFTASDATAYVAVVDSSYARTHGLRAGSTLTVAGRGLRVIGITAQGQSRANVYVPLATAQGLASSPGLKTLSGHVDAIYVKAAGRDSLASVQKEISVLLPHATLTSSSNLVGAVDGSLASAAELASGLGRWLAAACLAAAFAVAGLLTMASVTRRVRELGTLRALGWRGRRIVAQLMGESLVTGVAGAALGVALGFAGAGLVRLIAPELSATVPTSPGDSRDVAVHLTAPITPAAILLAVVLAVAGGLVAGALGGWRAVRLRPSEALGRIG
ncbi:ABC transporter permease [Actinomadura sp. DC4]|uniref:ABC transporter permease n=1 Tax=Actinomadura sp. DC4 TaxID=3055069 RepID=UPI0025B1671C|nr:ABC transporter permease [Actinomadura sp. DC4]MDN3358649.1 ABC transporter permease [Actinomadura sp. DC4]